MTIDKRSGISLLVKTALFSAIIAVISQIAIPLPSGVPMTLQSFVVCCAGFVLGKRAGAVSVLVYLAAGVCGAPVFYGFSGGIQHFTGPTGGFLAGFVIMAYLCAVGVGKWRFVSCIFGVLLCHMTGVFWYSYAFDVTLIKAFVSVSAMFLPKDMALSVLAAVFSDKLKKRIRM